MLTIDFETMPFNPDGTPPTPVGVAVKEDGQPATYYHWGHRPLERWRGERGVDDEGFQRAGRASKRVVRTTVLAGLSTLRRAIERHGHVLFHNALFDLSVLGSVDPDALRVIEGRVVHDTSWLLFLVDPNARELRLKPASEAWLGLPPTERDDVRAWLVARGVKRTAHERDVLGMPTPNAEPAAWSAFVPPRILGRYAIGDVDRTHALFKKLRPLVSAWKMDTAYERYQRAVLPILRMQQRGVVIDSHKADQQQSVLTRGVHATEEWLRRRLRTPSLNFNSPGQMVAALERAKVMDEGEWDKYLTPTGNRSAGTDVLLRCCADAKLVGALTYRAKASFALSTFLDRWSECQDIDHPHWSFTRGEGGGARTGRMSSSPNYQNLPKRVPRIVTSARDAAKCVGVGEPHLLLDHTLAKRVGAMPNLRECVVPSSSLRAFGDADYSQQELRILAHYAGGMLARAYRDDPDMDMHGYAGEQIRARRGRTFPRVQVKNVGFGTLYGSGPGKLAEQLMLDPTDPGVLAGMRDLRDAYYEAMPEVLTLKQDLERNPARNVTTHAMLVGPGAGRLGKRVRLDPLYTIGSRVCFVEPPSIVKGERRAWQYKLLNTAIQGSAGDQIIEALVALDDAGIDVVLPVHDQTLFEDTTRNIKSTAKEAVRIMEHVTDDMNRPDGGELVPFGIPMRVDVDIKRESWGED